MAFLKFLLLLISSVIQLVGIYVILQGLSGHSATFGGLGIGCFIYLVFCLLVLIVDIVAFYAHINQKKKLSTPFIYEDYMSDIFFIELLILFLATIPGVMYRDIRRLDP